MRRHPHSFGALIALCLCFMAPLARAQDRSPGETTAPGPATVSREPREAAGGEHKFWDKKNVALFTGVAASRALDYTSTRHFRARGVDEWLLTNSIVDNKPLFIGIEGGGTAVSMAVAYWLHRTGHHRLERWVSIIHIGVGTFGAIRNYGLANRRAP